MKPEKGPREENVIASEGQRNEQRVIEYMLKAKQWEEAARKDPRTRERSGRKEQEQIMYENGTVKPTSLHVN